MSADELQPLAEEARAAVVALRDVTARIRQVAELRKAQGRTLSRGRQADLIALRVAATELVREVDALVLDPAPADGEPLPADVRAELARIRASVVSGG